MTETYQDMLAEQALATKKKREDIIAKNLPYPCKKCWEEKFPEEFVIQYIENPIAGKYRYLYECKQCKKDRIYEKRWTSRETIEWAIAVIYKQLVSWSKQRRLPFALQEKDIMDMRNKQKGRCYYTWYEMTYEFIHYKSWKFNEKVAYQVSCDRLDNDWWYTKDNCVLCCLVANKMKWTMPEDEFYKICNDIIRNRRG